MFVLKKYFLASWLTVQNWGNIQVRLVKEAKIRICLCIIRSLLETGEWRQGWSRVGKSLVWTTMTHCLLLPCVLGLPFTDNCFILFNLSCLTREITFPSKTPHHLSMLNGPKARAPNLVIYIRIRCDTICLYFIYKGFHQPEAIEWPHGLYMLLLPRVKHGFIY